MQYLISTLYSIRNSVILGYARETMSCCCYSSQVSYKVQQKLNDFVNAINSVVNFLNCIFENYMYTSNQK